VTRAWLPPALLALYAAVFGWRALGGGLLVFDDHPGQLYRLAHAIALGFAPWRFNPGWWAGYAELQYYPPGFSWLGAVVYLAAGAALDVATVYQLLPRRDHPPGREATASLGSRTIPPEIRRRGADSVKMSASQPPATRR
jgi:hypothetical protein